MNKSEFLNELENRIRVLEKNEISDILGEYSQHIDMRVQSGLSESEAIKDFGSIEELTAEILEAYHVNPEYEREADIKEPNNENRGIKKRKNFASVVGIFAVIWKGIKQCFGALVNAVKNLFGKMKALLKKMFKPIQKENKREQFGLPEPERDTKQKMRSVGIQYKRAKGLCKGVVQKLLRVCFILIVLLCLLPVAALGIFSVFAVGLTIVFLIQGYPVIGIFMILLGLSVCSISVSGLLVSLVTKDKKNEIEVRDTEDDDETEEMADSEENGREDENE